jgi:hypothetical protein
LLLTTAMMPAPDPQRATHVKYAKGPALT